MSDCVICGSTDPRAHVCAKFGGENIIKPVLCTDCNIELYDAANTNGTCLECEEDPIFHHVKFVWRPSEQGDPMISLGPGLYCIDHSPDELRNEFNI